MTKEATPLQFDLFSGELVDTRSPAQKARDRAREKPQQMEMFSQREIAQFGVRAHPQMSLSAETKLVLISEDPRTDEERERDSLRAAQEQTYSLFGQPESASQEHPTGESKVSVQLSEVGTTASLEEKRTPAHQGASSVSGILWSADEGWLSGSLFDVPSTLRFGVKVGVLYPRHWCSQENDRVYANRQIPRSVD